MIGMEKIVNIRILFFAKARELAKCSECEENIQSEIECEQLISKICTRHNLESIKRNIILAIDGEYCSDTKVILSLKEGQEIAVIPPISGG